MIYSVLKTKGKLPTYLTNEHTLVDKIECAKRFDSKLKAQIYATDHYFEFLTVTDYDYTAPPQNEFLNINE